MLTARSVFKNFRGQELTYEDLRRQLNQVWAENLEKLPPEFSTRELFAVASRNGWIKQNAKGMIRVTMGRVQSARSAKRKK